MATIKEITTMCKAGQIQEAYELAKSAIEVNPNDVWAQRGMGWALYYLIRKDAENGQYDQLLARIGELQSLDQLNLTNDALIFENVIFWVGYFVKKHVTPTGIDSPARLSTLFAKFRNYTFTPSKGYSFILESFIKCDAWQEMLDFFEWWNLSNLRPEDYQPIEIARGRSIMSVAERAYIAKSKALIRMKDLGLIEEFLPEMDELMNSHPKMTYPGYFYGKLLLTLGSTPEDALRVIVPFARKKASEFWVWQLLSDVFTNDQEKQLACLLRAVHCKTQESFLGKVRIKLADLFIRRNELPQAKFQIDKVTQCYLSHGWHLPHEIDYWIHQPWINSIVASDESPINYQSISDSILLDGTEQAIAVVTYYDQNSKRATLIYGYEKLLKEKIRFKVGPGAVIKLNYITEADGRMRVLQAGKTTFPPGLDYAKVVQGTIKKRNESSFAFMHYGDQKAFVSPQAVNKYHVTNGENVKCLIVYDYDKKKEKWNWVVISINR
jgi:tetratricopeptide (TPR) repeat protein